MPKPLERDGQPDHLIKCWPEHFEAIWRGDKTHEIRKNDRDYKAGHFITIAEWLPGARKPTGRYVRAAIGHVSIGKVGSNVELPDGVAVFSFVVYSRSNP